MNKQIIYRYSQIYILITLILCNYDTLTKLQFAVYLFWGFVALITIEEFSSWIRSNLEIINTNEIITKSFESWLEASSIRPSGKGFFTINKEQFLKENIEYNKVINTTLNLVFISNFVLCFTLLSLPCLAVWVIYSFLVWIYTKN